jgi:hypothetical protein
MHLAIVSLKDNTIHDEQNFWIIIEPLLWVFIDDFEVYNNKTSHLANLKLLLSCVDDFLEGKMIDQIVSKNGMANHL